MPQLFIVVACLDYYYYSAIDFVLLFSALENMYCESFCGLHSYKKLLTISGGPNSPLSKSSICQSAKSLPKAKLNVMKNKQKCSMEQSILRKNAEITSYLKIISFSGSIAK